MKRHYPALRGLAIFLVVLHHSIVLGTSIPAEWGFRTAAGTGGQILTVLSLLGWVAVPIFLFLSGSFYAYAAQGTPPSISPKIVLTNILRLLWPYIIWSIIFYLVIWLGRGTTYSAFGYLKNLVTGYPFHFVPLILFYILVSPVIVWVANRIGWVWVLLSISIYQIFLILAVDSFQYGITLPVWTSNLVIPVLSRTMADWGIYFPLGLYMALNSSRVTPTLERLKWVFGGLGLLFFGITASHALGFLNFPMSRHLYPLMLIFVMPVLKKDQIPFRKWFETVGKHAYGLYLTHLIMIDIVLLLAKGIFPWLLNQPYLIHLVILVTALGIPLLIMNWASRSKIRKLTPYLFG
jgi:peptidoglycan/LPS O-acetylase OafA/YrhL